MGAFAAAAAIATVVAAAASAYSQYQQGQTQNKMFRYQAKQAENQATAARNAAAVQEQQARERNSRIQATARARAAASGVASYEGSPLLVLLENERQAEQESALIKYGGEIQSQSLVDEARLKTFQGRAAQRNATTGAGLTLLSGVASATGYGARSSGYTGTLRPNNPTRGGGGDG